MNQMLCLYIKINILQVLRISYSPCLDGSFPIYVDKMDNMAVITSRDLDVKIISGRVQRNKIYG